MSPVGLENLSNLTDVLHMGRNHQLDDIYTLAGIFMELENESLFSLQYF